MMHISIHAEGPGGTLGGPLWVLRKALEDLGFTVTDNNPYPFSDEEAEMVLKRADYSGATATITADNQPWGG